MADAVSEELDSVPGPIERETEKSELDSRLLKAAKEGHDDVIEKLLREGANINAVSEGFRETPLHKASDYGHGNVVRTLLDNGANVNSQDEDGWTPLYFASRAGFASIVNLLLFPSGSNVTRSPSQRVGAHPDLRSEIEVDLADHEHGLTPLHVASYWGEEDVVHAIVKFKSTLKPENTQRTLDKIDKFGRSALHIAVEQRYPGVIRKLIGTDTSLPLDHETALHMASRLGNAETVQALLHLNADVMAKKTNANNETPLHMAALHGHTQVVEQLLALTYELPHVLEREQVQGELSRMQRPPREVSNRQLLQNQMSAKTRDGNTALHLAASAGHHETVEELLEISLELRDQQAPDTRNNLGMTALHIASERGFTRVVQCILSKVRVDIWKRDYNGDSALHLASGNGNTDVIKVLLSPKIAPDVAALKNNRGETAVGRAISSQKWPASESILDAIFRSRSKVVDLGCVDLKEALISAARQRVSHNVVRFLLMMTTTNVERMKKCVDVQAGRNSSTRGWTALHWAAYHGNFVVVWWLLHESSWTDREMRTAHTTGKIGLQELQGTAEHRNPEDHEEHTYFQIKELMQSQEWSAKNVNVNEQHEKEKKPNNRQTRDIDERERYHLCLDMLKDPPLFEIPDSEKAYDMPKPAPDPDRILDSYYATIVDFYRHEDRSNLLRRSRNVSEVVYSKGGPDAIMKQARNTLGEVDKDAAKKKQFSEGDLRFRWVHLPANNLDWMTDLAQRIYMDKRMEEKTFRDLENFIWQSWYELPEGPSERQYMRPACKTELKSPNKDREPGSLSSDQDRFSKVALYMPYITFAVYTPEDENTTQRSEHFKRIYKVQAQNHSPYVAHDLQSLDDLYYSSFSGVEATKDAERYERLLMLYEGRIIHRSRTLDESYYDFLVDMDERNKDQVVTKHFVRSRNTFNRENYVRSERVPITRHPVTNEHDSNVGYSKRRDGTMKILRVDQLWLWVIDDKTIITSSTHRQDHADDPVIEKIFAYMKDENSKKKGKRPLPTTATEMSFFIPKFCIGFINYCNWNEEFDIDQSISQIFASSINDQSDRELQLFKGFTKKMENLVQDIEVDKSKRSQQRKFDSAESMTAEERRTFKSISQAANQLLEIKDIRDELNMLKSIVSQQKKVWDELVLGAPKNVNSRNAAEYTIANIQGMDLVASRIQDAILAIMNLEQSEASIHEAVSARRQTQETIEQGRTLMVFTVITIIFLPLSFLASLFALNITDFPHSSGDPQPGSLQYKLGWLFPILFGVTAGIFVFAVAIGFYRPLLRFWHSLRERRNSMGSGASSNKCFCPKWFSHVRPSLMEGEDAHSRISKNVEFTSALEKSNHLPFITFPYAGAKNMNQEGSLSPAQSVEAGHAAGKNMSTTYRYEKSTGASHQEPIVPIDAAEEHRPLVRRISSMWKHRHDRQRKTFV